MFSNVYVYAKNGDMIRLSSDKSKDEFWFKGDKIYKKSSESSVDELINSIKTHLKFYKEQADHLTLYIDNGEILFTDMKSSYKFLKEYNHKKYDLKKLDSAVIQLYNALETLTIEQPNLKKRLKVEIYESKILYQYIKTLLPRLDDIYSHIYAQKHDKITQSVYMLTFVSTIFLPLNLVTGFFGMNTGGMFLSGKYGTSIVLVAIIILILIFINLKNLAQR